MGCEALRAVCGRHGADTPIEAAFVSVEGEDRSVALSPRTDTPSEEDLRAALRCAAADEPCHPQPATEMVSVDVHRPPWAPMPDEHIFGDAVIARSRFEF